jgi:hypothetical protein
MVQVSYGLSLIYNVTFNCYYSIFEITSKDTYDALLGQYQILLNILFNLGYIYSAVKNIIILDEALSESNYWTTFGEYVGSIGMYFFYRDSTIEEDNEEE